MVRFEGAGLVATTNSLTPSSIQEALRMYFQPIKNDDPRLDFYTMYKRETMEYDTDYMQKYNEDLNTTLIFVRPCTTSYRYILLTTVPGRFVLRSQLRIRHRCPIEARAGSQRTVGNLSPSDSPHPQPIHCSRRRPRCSPSVEWGPNRDCYNLGPVICEPPDVAVGRIRRNAGQAVAKPVPSTHRRIYGRAVW